MGKTIERFRRILAVHCVVTIVTGLTVPIPVSAENDGLLTYFEEPVGDSSYEPADESGPEGFRLFEYFGKKTEDVGLLPDESVANSAQDEYVIPEGEKEPVDIDTPENTESGDVSVPQAAADIPEADGKDESQQEASDTSDKIISDESGSSTADTKSASDKEKTSEKPDKKTDEKKDSGTKKGADSTDKDDKKSESSLVTDNKVSLRAGAKAPAGASSDTAKPVLILKDSRVEFKQDEHTKAAVVLNMTDDLAGVQNVDVLLFDGDGNAYNSSNNKGGIDFYKGFSQSLQPPQSTSDNNKEIKIDLSELDSSGNEIILSESYLRLFVRLEDYNGNVSYYVSAGTDFELFDPNSEKKLDKTIAIDADKNIKTIIGEIKGQSPFAVYGSPKVEIQKNDVSDVITRKNGNTSDYIYTEGESITVDAADIPVDTLKVTLTQDGGKKFAVFKSSGYATSTHCFVYETAQWDFDTKGKKDGDGKYQLEASVPVIVRDKNGDPVPIIGVSIIDNNVSGTVSGNDLDFDSVPINAQNFYTYSEGFIRDTLGNGRTRESTGSA